jgi:hypothetical protein
MYLARLATIQYCKIIADTKSISYAYTGWINNVKPEDRKEVNHEKTEYVSASFSRIKEIIKALKINITKKWDYFWHLS